MLVFGIFAMLSVLLTAFAGPINVRIEAENGKDFHIGPEPRTRFELVEQYSPLATAKQVQSSAARAHASSLIKPRHPIRPHQQPVQVVVDFGEAGRDGKLAESTVATVHQELIDDSQQNQAPKVITRSQWLDWTKWTKCDKGERIRIRKCLMINGIPCEAGPSVERQKCFSANPSGIKFAIDPMIIEREIAPRKIKMQ